MYVTFVIDLRLSHFINNQFYNNNAFHYVVVQVI